MKEVFFKEAEMKREMLRLSFTAIALGVGGLAFGQATNSGDITGTVTDATGAIVPGVTVTVLDVDKGVSRTFATNGAGVYDTGSIVPDHYLLTFAKVGFATLKRGPITVSVGMMGLNVAMKVGETSQQVVVTAQAPLLETTSAEISSSIQSQTLAELPQVGTPDWQTWIGLQPGVSNTPQSGAGSPADPRLQGAANGSMPFITVLLDGAQTNSVMSDNVIFTPIFDAIGEVKMIDGLFSAQYGIGGVLYNEISKGGTSQYHGMAYDYFQNDAMNATPYSFGRKGFIPMLRYNDIGGNVGGPIPLPHLRKRAFFLIAHEYTINHAGGSNQIVTVPTAAMENGDFTGFNTIYDPTTQMVDPTTGTVTRQSFASEYGNGNKIPASMISPVAKALQKYYPAPTPGFGTTVNGIPTNNLFYNIPVARPFTKWFGRFDADVTPKNRLTGSAAWNDALFLPASPFCPATCQTTKVLNSNNQLSDVWTISNSLINEFRMGFMEEDDLWVSSTLGRGIPAAAGLQFSKADIFPGLFITGEQALTGGDHSGHYISNVLDPSDTVTWIIGRHDLHFGLEFLILRADSTPGLEFQSATLGFTGVYTASTQGTANKTGTPYADFLLGYAGSWSALNGSEYGARSKWPQLFLQDDWKVTPKLTMNLGLRWVGTTGFSEVHGNELAFDPTVMNPATNTPGAMWNGVTKANGRTNLEAPEWNEGWLPRVGFAYLFGQNTTIRGGYGVFTFPWSCNDYCANIFLANAGFMGGLDSGFGSESDSTNGAEPVVTLSDSGNTNFQGSKGASINSLYKVALTAPDAYNGQQVNYVQYKSPLARLQGWSLTVQHQFGQNLMAQVGYIGSHGGNLLFFHDLNQIPESKLSANDSNERPYPNFQGIPGNDGIATSNYNSLQGIVSQRLSAGLQFNFNYTFSKMLSQQDSSGWDPESGQHPFQNSYVASANYGPSNFDTRHAFKGQVVYQFPFGKGRALLNNNAVLNEVVGDWNLSTTMSMQSGQPFTPTMATNQSFSLSTVASQYPNVVGNPKAAGSSGTVKEWFNVAAFANPGAGKFGDMRRNSVYGPGTKLVNAALHKTFPIRERLNFEFYAEATNVLNHPSFQQPDSLIGPGHLGKITSVTVGGRSMMLIGKLVF